jgi:UDP-N-acetylglucosamine 2-epimerase (non-hydrolysing)/GDP/UDP-N,N'-diacetylbacillosamine 2-epimerase (hydrolysing)
MLAGAIAANYLQIPVAHIHGGEISGHVDGIIRHAITKLSHIHFASTENAKQRIIKLGEEAGKVYISGAPALDRIKGEKLPGKTELFKKYGFDEKKQLFLIVQHPDSSEKENAASKIKETIKAVLSFKAQTLMVYPNSDAGGRQMIDIIEGYKKSLFLTFAKSISHLDYLGFLQIADLLVGNSSSGIIEAPSFNIPVVNIGSRQEDREHASNVFNVGYDKEKIVLAVKNALKYGTMAKKSGDRIINPYGEGDASRKIVSVLEKVPLGRDLLLKRITY